MKKIVMEPEFIFKGCRHVKDHISTIKSITSFLHGMTADNLGICIRCRRLLWWSEAPEHRWVPLKIIIIDEDEGKFRNDKLFLLENMRNYEQVVKI